MFEPRFTITPRTATTLMSIEADRQAILELPLSVEVLAGLRETARLAATHYSTMIEGNRLTQQQVVAALEGAHFPGRERDETEVRNYYRALTYVETLATESRDITEDAFQRVHGLVMTGKQTPTPYREGQNVIREAATGRIVYLPPEASDVPGLMRDLFAWIESALGRQTLPAPLVAAITHYQYATIHPYYDGNGRTARLLTTLVLHRAGYGLKGIYSLDEHYARDLDAYYRALSVGPSHNYYLGRAASDITGFLEFFCDSMSGALAAIRSRASLRSSPDCPDQTALLRTLEPRQRRLLELFVECATLSNAEIAANLGLSTRTVASLTRTWVSEGFLEIDDPGRRTRRYRLAPDYEPLARPTSNFQR